jgi:hypothetical protein
MDLSLQGQNALLSKLRTAWFSLKGALESETISKNGSPEKAEHPKGARVVPAVQPKVSIPKKPEEPGSASSMSRLPRVIDAADLDFISHPGAVKDFWEAFPNEIQNQAIGNLTLPEAAVLPQPERVAYAMAKWLANVNESIDRGDRSTVPNSYHYEELLRIREKFFNSLVNLGIERKFAKIFHSLQQSLIRVSHDSIQKTLANQLSPAAMAKINNQAFTLLLIKELSQSKENKLLAQGITMARTLKTLYLSAVIYGEGKGLFKASDFNLTESQLDHFWKESFGVERGEGWVELSIKSIKTMRAFEKIIQKFEAQWGMDHPFLQPFYQVFEPFKITDHPISYFEKAMEAVENFVKADLPYIP